MLLKLLRPIEFSTRNLFSRPRDSLANGRFDRQQLKTLPIVSFYFYCFTKLYDLLHFAILYRR
jgi:hypothetical protein